MATIHDITKKVATSVYDWLSTSEPGSMYVYATCSALTDSGATYRIAKEMWALALEGRLYLVRKRLSHTTPSTFEYIAIKASDPPVRRLVTKDYGDEPSHRGAQIVRPIRYKNYKSRL